MGVALGIVLGIVLDLSCDVVYYNYISAFSGFKANTILYNHFNLAFLGSGFGMRIYNQNPLQMDNYVYGHDSSSSGPSLHIGDWVSSDY